MSFFSCAQGGTDRRVISKVLCVCPVQAEAGLLRGWVLRHSHSTCALCFRLRTFILTTPCSGPGLLSRLCSSMLGPPFAEPTRIRELFINSGCRGIYPDFVTECGHKISIPAATGDVDDPDLALLRSGIKEVSARTAFGTPGWRDVNTSRSRAGRPE